MVPPDVIHLRVKTIEKNPLIRKLNLQANNEKNYTKKLKSQYIKISSLYKESIYLIIISLSHKIKTRDSRNVDTLRYLQIY